MFAIIPQRRCVVLPHVVMACKCELYFNNMQIYNVECVLEVVCAVECVYCYGR